MDETIENQNGIFSDDIVSMAEYLPKSSVNGPLLRTVVWVQGCLKRCPDCFNPNYLPIKSAELISVEALVNRILNENSIDGVTFSGGEPFLQAGALSRVAHRLQKNRLSVVIYSGYTLEEIQSHPNDSWQRLLKYTDLLIDGPYQKDFPATHPYHGSGNQRLHFISNRFKDLENDTKDTNTGFEIHINAKGKIQITGFPDNSLNKNFDEIIRNIVTKL
jgi:anaerobic ribonucleoside-triphosphate reductase activating protein